MRIIISPAKKMNRETDVFEVQKLPIFLEDTKLLCESIKNKSYEELKELWSCSEKLAQLNYERFKEIQLEEQLTPAIVSFEGLQYLHMAPMVFTQKALDYLEEHLRILSGFYGVLTPFTGVTPYRLEMQAKLSIGNKKDLYEFWGDKLYQAVRSDDHIIINLASKEYAKAIEKYISPEDQFITIEFAEYVNGKVKQKGTWAKMARGEMVRFMAENQVSKVEELKAFNVLGYSYREDLSTDQKMVFIRKAEGK